MFLVLGRERVQVSCREAWRVAKELDCYESVSMTAAGGDEQRRDNVHRIYETLADEKSGQSHY